MTENGRGCIIGCCPRAKICRGLYFGLKTSENDIFSPSHDTPFFDSHRGLFALILPYFAIILPFYFPFSHFLPFLPFSFPFLPFFFYIFPLFHFAFSNFFPQMTFADIPLPGVFSNIYSPENLNEKIGTVS
jgi:hypothetical protein